MLQRKQGCAWRLVSSELCGLLRTIFKSGTANGESLEMPSTRSTSWFKSEFQMHRIFKLRRPAQPITVCLGGQLPACLPARSLARSILAPHAGPGQRQELARGRSQNASPKLRGSRWRAIDLRQGNKRNGREAQIRASQGSIYLGAAPMSERRHGSVSWTSLLSACGAAALPAAWRSSSSPGRGVTPSVKSTLLDLEIMAHFTFGCIKGQSRHCQKNERMNQSINQSIDMNKAMNDRMNERMNE